MAEMDTDSCYMALSGDSLDDVIKPHLKQDYMSQIYGSCDDRITPVWFPRKCCPKHQAFDKRTPGKYV